MFEMKSGVLTRKKYKLSKGLKKGLYVAAAVAVGIGSALVTVGTSGGFGTLTVVTSYTAAVAGITVALNWWKQNATRD